jgi:hypothetical protein
MPEAQPVGFHPPDNDTGGVAGQARNRATAVQVANLPEIWFLKTHETVYKNAASP